MQYNLNIYEIMFRYAVMMVLGIVGGATGQIWLVVLSMVIFLTAILGWCPIYQLLGINHAVKRH